MFRIHHLPEGEISVSDFEVTLNGQKVLPWFCRVSAMPFNTPWPGKQRPLEQTEIASFVSFEMDEAVEVKLIASRNFKELAIRPLSKGIEAKICGREITFCIEKCGHFTVELDGWHNALHIFANPYTDFGVDKNDPNVLYYGPGVHEIGNIELADGQTLFVDGGAVVYGSIAAFHKKDIRIVGYGLIDGSREVRTDDTLLITWDFTAPNFREEAVLRKHLKEKNVLNGCVHLYSCTDCELNGVIARDSSTFAFILADCERVECRWLKTIGMWRYNSDGIDLFNSRYIRVTDCFLRDFDDCMVIKGIKGWDTVNQHHIVVSGCTIWCDWGRGLEIGAETCADEYHDILWIDCDLIHGTHIHIDLHNGERAWVHDMLVKDIRCEYSKYDMKPVIQENMTDNYPAYGESWQPELIASPIYDGPWSDDHLLGRVSDVRFEDIKILCDEDTPVPQCRFEGANEVHCNKDIMIENVSRNGVRLKPEEVVLITGVYDHNIRVY